MNKNIKKIAVVGGGTAGLVSALILKTRFPDFQIDVIYSQSIGTIGVGEGSTEHWKEFMKFVGISQYDLIKNCDATYKMGIMFEDWADKPYYHSVQTPFANKIGQYSYVYSKLISEGATSKDMSTEVSWNNRVNVWFLGREEEYVANQYHFNTNKLGNYLTEIGKQRGINFYEDEINEVVLNETGEIQSLIGYRHTYDYDFYIDSTGFKKLLISKLGAKWISFEKYLRLNSAIVFPTEEEENYNTWTLSKAMSSGWLFRIPVWGRYGNGYIFDKNYIDANTAHKEVEEYFGRKITINKEINFVPGAVDRSWIKNCCAIGLSGSFFEPLEASSIGTSIQQSFLLMHMLVNYDEKTIDRYNQSFNDIIENIRDFIVLHYITKRNDSEFWKNIKNQEIPESLAENLIKWQTRLPIREDFKKLSDFILFKEDNFTMVLHGLGLFNNEAIGQEFKSFGNDVNELACKVISDEKKFVKEIKTVSHKDFLTLIRNLY
jgi:tryptophan halogenase